VSIDQRHKTADLRISRFPVISGVSDEEVRRTTEAFQLIPGKSMALAGPVACHHTQGRTAPRKPFDSVRNRGYYFLHERQKEITTSH
jgi:hypothetical protein